MGPLFGEATSIAVSISINFNVLYDDTISVIREEFSCIYHIIIFSQAMALDTLHELDQF